MSHTFLVKELISKYKENMDRQRELDELLLTDQSKQDWIACLQNRAVENQKMYNENGELLDKLEKWLEQPLDEESAEVLYRECEEMYQNGYDDCQVLLPMLYKGTEYYEKQENFDKLIFLYCAIFYEEGEVRNRREGCRKFDVTYLYKALQYKKVYGTKLDLRSRQLIWSSYYNLIVTGFANRAITADEAYGYYKEAMSFWLSPEVQELDGKDTLIPEIIHTIEKEWLVIEEQIEECSMKTKEAFCREALRIYEEEIKEETDILGINSEVYAAYLHAKLLMKEMTIDEIVDIYFAFYLEKSKRCSEDIKDVGDEFYFLINTPLILERWLHLGVSEEKSKQIMGILKQHTQETWYAKLGRVVPSFVNEIMAEWCFKLIQYMDSQEEKEECLFQLLVRRQLPTYLHSVMVTHLTEALCKEAKRNRPDLFEGLDEFIKNDLVGYAKRCAILHDVGKTRITDIVNTQSRRLWDREFNGIKQHPFFGAEMIERDSDLVKFRDVAFGHHKFYDGSAGYPLDFDNTKSSYRIMIDMITICDCIDAATDYLGRNYKRAKSLEDVLSELVEGKGTRYNPDLVEVIENSSRLIKEMSYIVSEGRLDIMYRAYLESVI